MARRKASWGVAHFIGESPAVLEKVVEKPIEEKISEKIGEIEKAFDYEEMTENKLITELNKIYIAYFVAGNNDIMRVKISDEDRLKLFYAHQIISGEMSKRHRRRSILISLVKG